MTLHSPAVRLRKIFDLLREAYGPQYWWPATTRFEVVLGAYLTQNTSWKAAERSLANLRLIDALTLEGFRALSVNELQELIRPSGFYTRKAPALMAFASMLDNEFGGSLELLSQTPTDALRKRLLALPGVGPETADAILLYALNHPVPVVDEYLRRMTLRHGLIATGHESYESLAELTRLAFADDPSSSWADLFNEFHALTVAVGKGFCARNPTCEGCPLASDPHLNSIEPRVRPQRMPQPHLLRVRSIEAASLPLTTTKQDSYR